MSLWEKFLNVIVGRDLKFPLVTVSKQVEWTGYRNVTQARNTLVLDRLTFTDNSTIGQMYLDGDPYCFSLERPCRDIGTNHPLAIPAGTYEITLYNSPSHGYVVPLLNEVPGRTAIEIHIGNYSHDSKGCILVAMRKDVDVIWDSETAFKKLVGEIEARLKEGKFYISILGGTLA